MTLMDANTLTVVEVEIPSESRYLIRPDHDTAARRRGRFGKPLYCLAANSEPHNNPGLNHAKLA